MNFLAKIPGVVRLAERFGRLESLKSTTKLIEATSLSRNDLASLFHHKAIAIHVKGFYPPDLCDEVAAVLRKEPRRNWRVQSGTGEVESTSLMLLYAH